MPRICSDCKGTGKKGLLRAMCKTCNGVGSFPDPVSAPGQGGRILLIIGVVAFALFLFSTCGGDGSTSNHRAGQVRGYRVSNSTSVKFGSAEWYDKSSLWGPDALGYYYLTREDSVNGVNKILLTE